MHQTNFLVREPLLDAKQRVVGYELSWQQQKSAPASTPADLELLVDFVAEQMVDEDNGNMDVFVRQLTP